MGMPGRQTHYGQTERQSVLAYHKDHEANKGQVTAVVDDVATRTATMNTKKQSTTDYKQSTVVRPCIGAVAYVTCGRLRPVPLIPWSWRPRRSRGLSWVWLWCPRLRLPRPRSITSPSLVCAGWWLW